MVGLELGPRNGAFASTGGVFLGLTGKPCFFNRASAAAARSARIFSRSVSVKFSSMIGLGISCLSVLLLLLLCVRFAISLAVPNRCPFSIFAIQGVHKPRRTTRNQKLFCEHNNSTKSGYSDCLNNQCSYRTSPWNAFGFLTLLCEFNARRSSLFVGQQFPISSNRCRRRIDENAIDNSLQLIHCYNLQRESSCSTHTQHQQK